MIRNCVAADALQSQVISSCIVINLLYLLIMALHVQPINISSLDLAVTEIPDNLLKPTAPLFC